MEPFDIQPWINVPLEKRKIFWLNLVSHYFGVFFGGDAAYSLVSLLFQCGKFADLEWSEQKLQLAVQTAEEVSGIFHAISLEKKTQ